MRCNPQSSEDLLSGLERPISPGPTSTVGVEHPLDTLEPAPYLLGRSRSAALAGVVTIE
jgi:hypothetical protein